MDKYDLLIDMGKDLRQLIRNIKQGIILLKDASRGCGFHPEFDGRSSPSRPTVDAIITKALLLFS
jgi:hypothetical protein